MPAFSSFFVLLFLFFFLLNTDTFRMGYVDVECVKRDVFS